MDKCLESFTLTFELARGSQADAEMLTHSQSARPLHERHVPRVDVGRAVELRDAATRRAPSLKERVDEPRVFGHRASSTRSSWFDFQSS